MNIFKQALKSDFEKLPELFKFIHGDEEFIEIIGEVEVKTSNDFFLKLIAFFSPIPPNGIHDTHLLILKFDESEQWQRDFGDHKMYSEHFIENETIFEKIGLLKIYYNLDIQGKTLYFTSFKTKFLNIELPKFLSPKISATFDYLSENEYFMKIETFIFNNSLLARYFGKMSVYMI